MIDLDDKWFIVYPDDIYGVPPFCFKTQKEALKHIISDKVIAVDFLELNNLIEKNNYALYGDLIL